MNTTSWSVMLVSDFNQDARRIFDALLDAPQEGHRLAAIDDAMVVRQRQIHDRPNLHLACDGHWTLDDVVQTQDATLGRVDDRRREHGSVDAAVTDRERSARQFLELDVVLLRTSAIVGDAALDLGETQAIGVANDRNYQPLAATDGNADVEVVLVDDLPTVHLGVDGRELLQRFDRSLHEEGHEAELDAVLLHERVLVLLAQGHDTRHVDLVEGGQERHALLRFDQALGNLAAHRRHVDDLLASFVGTARSRRGGNRGCSGCLERRLTLDVFLQHAAARARRRHRRWIDAGIRGGATCRGHDAGKTLRRNRVADTRRLRRAIATRDDGRRSRRRNDLGFGGGRLHLDRLRRASTACGRHGAWLEHAHHVTHGRVLSRANEDLGQDSILGRSDLDGDLVRFDDDEHLVATHCVSFFLQPLADLHFRDRLARWRHLELDGHLFGLPTSLPSVVAAWLGCSVRETPAPNAPDLARSPEIRQAIEAKEYTPTVSP